eukprot:TRINITY_DN6714_c0_g1_i2.p1 TRINITY_DN6714_c0_g1~~TRINITY_DN6714_c0_g1_i2.p1  ORF type:complete len:348 (-),score=43.05 TRINITY_DN6714_c0_g1_i2:85-1128(-)
MVRIKSKPRKSLQLVVQDLNNHSTIVFYRPKIAVIESPKITKPQTKSTDNKSRGDVTTKTPIPQPNTTTPTPQAPKETKKHTTLMQHPLVGHEDVPKLTDLQMMITQAILQNGEPCPFEKIYEFVSANWKGMRRRDGTPYSTDCRRAIQANLRQNPNHISLFIKDTDSQNSWRLCHTIEESMRSKEKLKDREAKLSSLIVGGPRTRSQDKSKSNRHSATLGLKAQKNEELTAMQTLISSAIESKSKPITIGEIEKYVVQYWKDLKGTEISKPKTTIRKIVQLSLVKNNGFLPVFMRDPANWIVWKFASNHPWISASQEAKDQKIQEVRVVLTSKDESFWSLAEENKA